MPILQIPLLHGWLYNPEDKLLCQAIRKLSHTKVTCMVVDSEVNKDMDEETVG